MQQKSSGCEVWIIAKCALQLYTSNFPNLASFYCLPWKVSKVKVRVVLYTFICRGVPVREDIYPESSACEVGWPVPFLAAFNFSIVATRYPFAAG